MLAITRKPQITSRSSRPSSRSSCTLAVNQALSIHSSTSVTPISRCTNQGNPKQRCAESMARIVKVRPDKYVKAFVQ